VLHIREERSGVRDVNTIADDHAIEVRGTEALSVTRSADIRVIPGSMLFTVTNLRRLTAGSLTQRVVSGVSAGPEEL
jgi:hypothetical protein